MKIFFIGIGGIGMSALARFFVSQGHQVSGSDAHRSEIVDDLIKEGITIYIGHKSNNINNRLDRVVYSAAISANNPEMKKTKKLKIQTQSYAQALGELTKNYFTIAICGSHGKSTTTALLSLVMIKAGFDPTVILGTKLKEFNNSNFRLGKSCYLIIEADEYSRAFHNYFPKIIVTTNVDKEHLDIYKNLKGVIKSFNLFFKNLQPGGIIITNRQDINTLKALKNIHQKKVYFNQKTFEKHNLQITGFYNQLNAEAVWQAAKYLGVARSVAERSFSNYCGAWRRLEKISSKKSAWKGYTIFSDYAHHPTEINATLQGLKEYYSKSKIICVFQPHQQDRLTRLFKDYIPCFKASDELFLLPAHIVQGRDNYLSKRKSSLDLYRILKKKGVQVFYSHQLRDVLRQIEDSDFPKNTIIVFMGAGSLDAAVKRSL